MIASWYLALGDRREGPVTFEALRERLAQGDLPPDTLVWGPGLPAWSPARSVQGLIGEVSPPPLAPAPPPLPGERESPSRTVDGDDVVVAEIDDEPLAPEAPPVQVDLMPAPSAGPSVGDLAQESWAKATSALGGLFSGLSGKSTAPGAAASPTAADAANNAAEAAKRAAEAAKSAATEAWKNFSGLFTAPSAPTAGPGTVASPWGSSPQAFVAPPGSGSVQPPYSPTMAPEPAKVPVGEGRATVEVHLAKLSGFGDSPVQLLLDGQIVAVTTWPEGFAGLEFETTSGQRRLVLQTMKRKDVEAVDESISYEVLLPQAGHYVLKFADRWFLQEFPSSASANLVAPAKSLVQASPWRTSTLVGKWESTSKTGKWMEFAADGSCLTEDGGAGRFALTGTRPTERLTLSLVDGRSLDFAVVSASKERLVLSQSGAAEVYAPWRASAPAPAPAPTPTPLAVVAPTERSLATVEPPDENEDLPQTAVESAPGEIVVPAPPPMIGASPAPATRAKPASSPAVEVAETDPKRLYDGARERLKQGQLDEALAWCDALLKIKPTSKQALALRGKTRLALGENLLAVADLAKVNDDVAAADRHLWQAYRALALQSLSSRNPRQAIQYLDAAQMKTSHGNAEDTPFLRGLAYLEAMQADWDRDGRFEIHETEAAQDAFDEALAGDPTFAAAYVGKGRTRLLAVGMFQKMFGDDDDRYGPKIRGELRQAVADFGQAIERDETFADAWFYRAETQRLLADRGERIAAADIARDHEAAAKLSPHWAELLKRRAADQRRREQLARLDEQAREAERRRQAEEIQREEEERQARIGKSQSETSVLGSMWNWLSGKWVCPECGTRKGVEENRQLLDVQQHVRTDWERAKGSYQPQAVFNVCTYRGTIACKGCGHQWHEIYCNDRRA